MFAQSHKAYHRGVTRKEFGLQKDIFWRKVQKLDLLENTGSGLVRKNSSVIPQNSNRMLSVTMLHAYFPAFVGLPGSRRNNLNVATAMNIFGTQNLYIQADQVSGHYEIMDKEVES